MIAPWLLLGTAAILCVSQARAQTTMTGSIRDVTGSAALTATCTFRAGAYNSAAGGWIVPGSAASRTVTVTASALSVALTPTDTATPSGYYEMRCHIPLQTADGRSCEGNSSLVSQGLCVVGPGDTTPVYIDVPTSASPVDISAHWRTGKPAPPALFTAIAPLLYSGVAGSLSLDATANFTPTGFWNFRLAAHTLPDRVGTGSPIGRDNCLYVGESYFQTDSVAGQNVFRVTALGTPCTWTLSSGAVLSVYGRAGAVTAQSGDYTTSQVTESGNLYFTNARVLSAMAGLYQAPISGAPGTWPTSFTPSAHAATHGSAGADPVTLAESQVTGLTSDLGSKANLAGGNTFTGNQTVGDTVLNPSASEPTCDVSHRGHVVRVLGGAGVADTYRQCNKLSDDSYSWVGMGGVSSGGGLTILTGSVDPSGSCAGVNATSLTLYSNSATPALWYCNASGAWERIQSTTMVGSFILNGLTGTQPATPPTGYISCWLDSTLKLLECVDDSGAVSKIGGYYQNIEGAGKFEETVNTSVATKRDKLQFRRGLSVSDDGTDTTRVDVNWLDLRTAFFVEEFYRVQGSSVSGTIGQGWAFAITGTGSTTTATASAWPNLGVQKVVTGTTAAAAGMLCLDSGSGAAAAPFGALGTVTSWGVVVVSSLSATSAQRFYAGVGLSCTAGQALDAARFMGLRFDQNSGVPAPDTTNFSFYVKGDTGAGVAVGTGVPADTAFHALSIYSTVVGVIRMSLDGGPEKTFCASGANAGGNCDGTITIPTSKMQPMLICGTDGGAQTCNFDKFAFDPHVASFATNRRN
jgi:hypothetical protein